MIENERDRLLQDFLDSGSRLRIEAAMKGMSEEDRSEFGDLIEVADLLWEAGHGAPPLESDPVAAMLGLVADTELALDPRALARARKNARLKPSVVAERLEARGWDIAASDVFRWETRPSFGIAPALISAIAEVIGVRADQITADGRQSVDHQNLALILSTDRFNDLVARWARLQGTSRALAKSALQSRLLATVHRGDSPDQDQILQSLAALIDTIDDVPESDL